MTHRSSTHRPVRMIGAVAVALVTLAACGEDFSGDKSSAATAAPSQAPTGEERSVSVGGEQPAAFDEAPVSNVPAVLPVAVAGEPRQLVITMTVGVEVADAGLAVDQVIDLAQSLGGQLFDSSLDLGNQKTAAGDLVFKLPPDKVDAFLRGLEPRIGRRTALQGTTSDVTAQLADLDAQILTARKSVERVRELLDTADGLGQVITLEGELAARETRLEQLLAQQADLSNRVAMATITVRLTTAPEATIAAAVEPADERGLGDAFRSGWQAFVSVLMGIALFVGYTAPFLVIGLVALLLGWRLRRRLFIPPVATPPA